jgi:hypothetical protein
MREIKFRAWLESLQAMVSVHKIEFLDDGNYKIFFKNLQNGKYVDCALAPSSMISRSSAKGERFVLMQYTGANDKNGVEIYTGYIVKFISRLDGSKRMGTVRYWAGDAAFLIECEREIFYLFHDALNCEVIGNIYENPEILKDRQ